MGLYSNINYKAYKTLANNSIEELSSKSFDSVIDDLSVSNVLNIEIRKKCSDLLKEITSNTSLSGSIASLKVNLKKVVDIMDLVKKYQDEEEKKEPDEDKLKKIEEKINNIISSSANNAKIQNPIDSIFSSFR